MNSPISDKSATSTEDTHTQENVAQYLPGQAPQSMQNAIKVAGANVVKPMNRGETQLPFSTFTDLNDESNETSHDNAKAHDKTSKQSSAKTFRYLDDDDDNANDDDEEEAGRQDTLPKNILGVISPTSAFRTRWDLAFLILLVYNLMDIPYRAAFEVDTPEWGVVDIFDLLCDVFFLTDVLLNFRTGFYRDGVYIKDNKKIAQRYLKSWFFLDFLTSLPLKHLALTFASGAGAGQWLRVPRALRFFRYARVFKMLRVFKMFQVISKWEDEANYISNLVGTFKMIFIIYFICHTSACSLMLVTQFEVDEVTGQYNSESWVAKLGYSSREFLDVGATYLAGIYWAITTIATVGYGDITPGTDAEIGVTIVVVFIGSCTFGYIVGNMASYVSSTDESTRQLRQKIKAIKEYIRYRCLPPSLSRRIRSHYEYAWKRSTVYNEERILADLPSFLRTEVITYLYRELIDGVPLLQEMGNDCATLLVTKLKPMYLAPGQYVFIEGSVGQEMYIISEGVIELIRENEVLSTYSTGAYVGEYSILTEKPQKRTCSIRAKTYVHLLALSKEEYDSMLELYPEVYAHMARKADYELTNLTKNDSNKQKILGLKRIQSSIHLRARTMSYEFDSSLEQSNNQDKVRSPLVFAGIDENAESDTATMQSNKNTSNQLSLDTAFIQNIAQRQQQVEDLLNKILTTIERPNTSTTQ